MRDSTDHLPHKFKGKEEVVNDFRELKKEFCAPLEPSSVESNANFLSVMVTGYVRERGMSASTIDEDLGQTPRSVAPASVKRPSNKKLRRFLRWATAFEQLYPDSYCISLYNSVVNEGIIKALDVCDELFDKVIKKC
eukprot:UN25691